MIHLSFAAGLITGRQCLPGWCPNHHRPGRFYHDGLCWTSGPSLRCVDRSGAPW